MFKGEKCFVIAEIGVNHGGSIDLAYKMIDEAKRCQADAVKFQTFQASRLVSKNTPKVHYQMSTTDKNESHFKMIQNLEFKYEDHEPVINYCKAKRIEFISTPYDIESAVFLNKLGVNIFKTASADIVDLPLHKFLSSTGKKVIISTGMASLGEIEEVLSIYKKENIDNVALLHCVANYPCSYQSLNLRVITTLKEAFGLPVGFSDHAEGSIPAAASIALGATIVEKHFTLDRNMVGPDHKASSTPEEFRALVQAIRITEASLGSKVKSIQIEEKDMRKISRKSLFLAKDVREGQVLDEHDFTLKRPGSGIYANVLPVIVGRKASRELKKGKILEYGDFK
ncbi:MAG: N-acetylneuraminate synthase [Porticoccaceae bacterium]|nr:N-acetylneuraminate synthase [Porticoccaceae bacterium]|tara:strand:- start:35599 stop:36618 length:1020 start_codon:yes stop_codon:yes gene_type:complete